MIILYACLMLLLTYSLLPNRHIGRLAYLRIRGVALIWAALLAQIVIISVISNPAPEFSAAVHIGTYVLAGAFAAVNLHLGVGVWVISVGGTLNAAAIVANGGTMPASPAALERSGWVSADDRFANSAVLAEPRFAVLGDIFSTPEWIPVNSVFSVGDVIIVAGVMLFLHVTTAPALPSKAGSTSRGDAPGELGLSHGTDGIEDRAGGFVVGGRGAIADAVPEAGRPDPFLTPAEAANSSRDRDTSSSEDVGGTATGSCGGRKAGHALAGAPSDEA